MVNGHKWILCHLHQHPLQVQPWAVIVQKSLMTSAFIVHDLWLVWQWLVTDLNLNLSFKWLSFLILDTWHLLRNLLWQQVQWQVKKRNLAWTTMCWLADRFYIYIYNSSTVSSFLSAVSAHCHCQLFVSIIYMRLLNCFAVNFALCLNFALHCALCSIIHYEYYLLLSQDGQGDWLPGKVQGVELEPASGGAEVPKLKNDWETITMDKKRLSVLSHQG